MSFLTGSRVYGTPRPDSDIDLVVLVTEEDLARLREVGTVRPQHTGYNTFESCSLYFGNLNLIAVTKPDEYTAWLIGTNNLRDHAPVTRAQAVQEFDMQLVAMKAKRIQNANSTES